MSHFNAQEKSLLLSVAQKAILSGFEIQNYLKLTLTDYPNRLKATQASFVTLQQNGGLRGCIGSLEPRMPLIEDVAMNAVNAAFRDHRFPPVQKSEYSSITIHISVLSIPQPMVFSSEAELLSQLRPGVDGLILSDKGRRGTFLPAVWDSLPTPKLFLQHLKQKAGLPSTHWSDTLCVKRYTAEVIE